MSQKVHISVMGCPKNAVDSEFLAGELAKRSIEIVELPEVADALVVMSCGFTKDAREESVSEMLRLAGLKRSGRATKLIVAGCLSQMHPDALLKEIPEIDEVFGVERVDLVARAVEGECAQTGPRALPLPLQRYRLSSEPFAYLKISEGCNRKCSFCSIPSIKGKLKSRDIESLILEAGELVEDGAKEIALVSQDTTSYGEDLDGDSHLKSLIELLCDIDGLDLIRVLYLFPDNVNRRFVEDIYENTKVCKYFDIPFQHSSESLLKAMNRNGSAGEYLDLLRMLRETQPESIVRSSFIVGHPGETEGDFEELLSFVEESEIDWITAFPFSVEAGTTSEFLPGKVERNVIIERLNEFDSLCHELMAVRRSTQVGREIECLVERKGDSGLECRSYMEAPEVDGIIHLVSDNVDMNEIKIGDIIKCRITGNWDLDLFGEPVC